MAKRICIKNNGAGKEPGSLALNDSEMLPEALNDVFRCFICMEKLQEAHLCPHCSKLCCFMCISRWLNERRSCPHCRQTLLVGDLVNCRWLEDVASQVESLQQICANIKAGNVTFSSHDQCQTHKEKLSVYCWTCKTCICHQCALFGGTHSGHNFKQLELVYETHVNQVKEEVSQLRSRLLELLNLLKSVESNMDSIRSAKDEKVREIRNIVELMVGRLDTQLKFKLLTLTRQKQSLQSETKQLENLLHEIDSQLSTFSKSQLIMKSPDLLKMIHQVRMKPISSCYDTAPIPADFVSEIIPPYDTGVFVIQNFTKLQLKAEPVYSSPLRTDGLCWRLKVYPYGNGAVRKEFLSVFLELSAGYPETSKYEYRVQMIHPNATKIVQREFVSDFEMGECWGYNRFFRLDSLAKEGYLNSMKDTVELRFQVRPSSYFQKCRDQQWYINRLLRQQQEQLKQIKELKQRLDREVAKNKVSTESTTSFKIVNGNAEEINDNKATTSPEKTTANDKNDVVELKKCDRPEHTVTTSLMSNILKIRENKTSVEIKNTEKPHNGDTTKDAFDDLLQLLNISSPVASVVNNATSDTSGAAHSDPTQNSPPNNKNTAINFIKVTPLSHSSPNLRSSSSDLDADDVIGAVGGVASQFPLTSSNNINNNNDDCCSSDDETEADQISGENFVEYAEIAMDQRMLGGRQGQLDAGDNIAIDDELMLLSLFDDAAKTEQHRQERFNKILSLKSNASRNRQQQQQQQENRRSAIDMACYWDLLHVQNPGGASGSLSNHESPRATSPTRESFCSNIFVPPNELTTDMATQWYSTQNRKMHHNNKNSDTAIKDNKRTPHHLSLFLPSNNGTTTGTASSTSDKNATDDRYAMFSLNSNDVFGLPRLGTTPTEHKFNSTSERPSSS